jgi:hypothetical protein
MLLHSLVGSAGVKTPECSGGNVVHDCSFDDGSSSLAMLLQNGDTKQTLPDSVKQELLQDAQVTSQQKQ